MMTQFTIAEIGDITHHVLYSVEKGQMPLLEIYIKLCFWLEVNLDHFIIQPQKNC
ncbi:MAG: hypothetical protein AAF599_05355 [Bacteroidota bacterium]